MPAKCATISKCPTTVRFFLTSTEDTEISRRILRAVSVFSVLRGEDFLARLVSSYAYAIQTDDGSQICLDPRRHDERVAVLAREVCVGLAVVPERLGLRVEIESSACPIARVSQMAEGCRDVPLL